MKIAAAALLLLLAAPASATQEYILPTLFDVTGVASDDVLNVRAAPSADAEIIGTLAPDAERVEVTAHDASGRWGQVNIDGRSGWASLHYLAYRADVWEPGGLPRDFSCGGTEPFWSFSTEDGTLTWSTPEGEAAYSVQAIEGSGVFRDPRRALIATRDGGRLTAVAVPPGAATGCPTGPTAWTRRSRSRAKTVCACSAAAAPLRPEAVQAPPAARARQRAASTPRIRSQRQSPVSAAKGTT